MNIVDGGTSQRNLIHGFSAARQKVSHHPENSSIRLFFVYINRDTAIQDAAPGVQGQALSKPCRGASVYGDREASEKGVTRESVWGSWPTTVFRQLVSLGIAGQVEAISAGGVNPSPLHKS